MFGKSPLPLFKEGFDSLLKGRRGGILGKSPHSSEWVCRHYYGPIGNFGGADRWVHPKTKEVMEMRTILYGLVILLAMVPPAFGTTIYKWVDKEGVVNLTDDAKKIAVQKNNLYYRRIVTAHNILIL